MNNVGNNILSFVNYATFYFPLNKLCRDRFVVEVGRLTITPVSLTVLCMQQTIYNSYQPVVLNNEESTYIYIHILFLKKNIESELYTDHYNHLGNNYMEC